MFETIIKRNGTVVPFDPQKITIAILKAGQATGEFDEKTARRLCRIVVAKAVKGLDQAGVEAIQDIVEVTLMENGYYRTAKAYILYREQHAKIRKVNELLGLNLVNDYLGKSDWRVKENSNMDYSLQGLNNYLAGHIVSTYWLNQIYPPEVREAHTSGDIHIHDLNSLSPYCVGWDLADLLVKGFRGVTQKADPDRQNISGLSWDKSTISCIHSRGRQRVRWPSRTSTPFWLRSSGWITFPTSRSNRASRSLFST